MPEFCRRPLRGIGMKEDNDHNKKEWSPRFFPFLLIPFLRCGDDCWEETSALALGPRSEGFKMHKLVHLVAFLKMHVGKMTTTLNKEGTSHADQGASHRASVRTGLPLGRYGPGVLPGSPQGGVDQASHRVWTRRPIGLPLWRCGPGDPPGVDQGPTGLPLGWCGPGVPPGVDQASHRASVRVVWTRSPTV
ncbi:hypothetical protein PRIPAC_77614 [Pristionchus pacificus]|uniref:Uncharacterized protein n=1 Tax=Pristionchus pacificus TaxID=54126 RepID=A0A2A6BI08_PRIPA|nr:hypothetical protein PRIPAC_77614 [Pristionchus pacificus]|eukprot:PDM65478.1 hypothetical protein PRIPAC_52420 [Pristionchus pacificus]